jgi:fructokinase
MLVLGYDVGGTKIEAAVVELTGGQLASHDNGATPTQPWDAEGSANLETHGGFHARILSRVRRPTERTKGYDHILTQMAACGLESVQQAGCGLAGIGAIGVGLPGAVDPVRQVMLNGNTLALIGHPVAKDLPLALGIAQHAPPVAMGNDANCFALAEHYCGVGLSLAREWRRPPAELSGIGIILGTGCGGGFILQGQLCSGSRGGAAEVGHTVLYRGGHACYCGQRGCAEQYLSGTAIEAHYASRRYSQVTDVHTSQEIFEQAKNGEPLAVAVVKAYRADLAAFLAGLTNLLNPDYFVLGGGVSLQDSVYLGLDRMVLQQSFLPLDSLRIEKHHLGDSAGVVGAALLPVYRQNLPVP